MNWARLVHASSSSLVPAQYASQGLCNGVFASSVIATASSVGLLILAPVRIFSLRNESIKVSLGRLAYAKQASSFLVALLQVTQVTILLRVGFENRVELLGLCASLVASLLFIWLSILEHRRSTRPSTLIVVYLFLTICGNIVSARQEFVISKGVGIHFSTASLLGGELFARLLLMILEAQSKAKYVFIPYKSTSPEDTAGVFSKIYFWWLTDLLVTGKKRILRVSDTAQLSTLLQPSRARKNVLEAWNQRVKPEGSLSLVKAVGISLRKPLLSPVIPRLFLTAFRCSQPIIISQAITFVKNDQEGTGDQCGAFTIFCAALIVYFGLAISSSMYMHRLNRLKIITRASLVGLVYEKALNLSHDGSDAGRVVTIMSTDIDAVSDTGALLHAAWGQFFELVGGLVLLAREVGWLFPVPLVTIFFASRVSRFVAQNVRARTKSWNDATQARISTLSSILGSMRSVKAMGLSEAIAGYVTNLRDKEIASSKHVRWMQVGYNASANANGLFTPVITVVLFALLAASRGESLDTKTAFTTVAILTLVTHPANMIMTIVPRFIGSMANIDRIQTFLLESSKIDCRKVANEGNRPLETETGMGISVHDVTINYKSNTTSTLRNINLSLPKHSISICAGPTGCGKTTLAKTILGEIVPAQGVVAVSSARIAYCDQRPWIPTGSIREVICAFAESVDEKLYEEALRVCCLDYDLQRLPEGDKTVVGSRGVNLSGGQRQRLALARMVYSGASIAVLDDPFSALDGATENKVIKNLLGRNGWFRKAKVTAFIITNAAQHFHYSDRVILIDDGQVVMEGDWRRLKSHAAEMQKFSFEDVHHESTESKGNNPSNVKELAEKDAEQDLHRSAGDLSLYGYYIRSVGVGNFLLLATCTALYAFFNTFSVYWFKSWTESDGTRLAFYIAGYILCAFIAWAATSANLWSTYILLAPRSGRLLHESLLKTIFAAPLLYFSSTDIGVILNRFSQDISLVDRQLPSALSALCSQIFKMIAQIGIMMQVQRPLLATLPICSIVVYFVQKLYLRTSRQLRVLELESHSALYSWFLETTEGLVSIRAFSWIKPATRKNLDNLETSIRPSYSLLSLQCWLNLVLDLIVSCIAIGVILIAITWRSETSAANIGVSLNLIIVVNTTLVRLVESFTQMEVSLGAMARLKEVETRTPSEDKLWEDQVPEAAWPATGCLTLRGLNAGYDNERNVLQNVSLGIDQGRKLVICGRTGSGKSTIILALLRLIESSGDIDVGQHSLSRIPRSIIRSRGFITVPQEPFFLPNASLKFNLDPDSLATEDMLREALQCVGIWDALCQISSEIATDTLSQAASCLQSLSVGQLQLISMARAVVKKKVLSQGPEFRDSGDSVPSPKPILLLDEATSSLDTATEATIYDILESEFIAAGYTVVIVAHRISVLSERMRSGKDRIAWLQDGRVFKVGDYEEIAEFSSSSANGEQ